MSIEPKHLDLFLQYLDQELLILFNKLPREVQDLVRLQWRAAKDAIVAMRGAVGTPGQMAALRAMVEALRQFITALATAGVAASSKLTETIAVLEIQAGGGTAGVVATEALLVLALWIIAVLLWMKAINEILIAKGPVAPPIGGILCGGIMPAIKGQVASSWSPWGEYRAFSNAVEKARSVAQTIPCPAGNCTVGICRGNCSITDITYGYWGLWSTCTVIYDVYCECY